MHLNFLFRKWVGISPPPIPLRVVVRILEVNIYKMVSQRLARNKMSCVLVTLVTVGYYHYYHNYSHTLVACGSNPSDVLSTVQPLLEHRDSITSLGCWVLSSFLLSLSLTEPLDLEKGVHISGTQGTFPKDSCPTDFGLLGLGCNMSHSHI